uniref:DNA-directed RNA polymerase RBP11-like dimerisation domain-containing protein n=1 Tax=Arcella intermedia TaxID=1963864 RepID=A0A6B2LSX8_9EUKA
MFDQPDQQKVSFNKDTKIPNAGTFIINKEDHTLGNLIRMQLYKDPQVLFCGYRIPHPLENLIQINIQTVETTTPMKVMQTALDKIMDDLSKIEKDFNGDLRKRRTYSSGYKV